MQWFSYFSIAKRLNFTYYQWFFNSLCHSIENTPIFSSSFRFHCGCASRSRSWLIQLIFRETAPHRTNRIHDFVCTIKREIHGVIDWRHFVLNKTHLDKMLENISRKRKRVENNEEEEEAVDRGKKNAIDCNMIINAGIYCMTVRQNHFFFCRFLSCAIN